MQNPAMAQDIAIKGITASHYIGTDTGGRTTHMLYNSAVTLVKLPENGIAEQPAINDLGSSSSHGYSCLDG